MGITYDSICEKLGFEPKEYRYNCSEHEDDSKKSPLAVLTYEELDFLSDYLINKRK